VAQSTKQINRAVSPCSSRQAVGYELAQSQTMCCAMRVDPLRAYAAADHSTKPYEHLMATSAKKANRKTSRDLGVIGARVLDDAYMTWVASEVESERALRAWFEAAASQRAAGYLAYGAAVDREEAAARDLQRLCELLEPDQERIA
jgi:hypothetical protein